MYPIEQCGNDYNNKLFDLVNILLIQNFMTLTWFMGLQLCKYLLPDDERCKNNLFKR